MTSYHNLWSRLVIHTSARDNKKSVTQNKSKQKRTNIYYIGLEVDNLSCNEENIDYKRKVGKR